MNKLYGILIILICIFMGISSVWADDIEARNIMQKVLDRDDGNNQTSDMKMILIDKNGKKRIRDIRSFKQDRGEDKYSLMFFMTPADVKGTGFLNYDYDDSARDDDQWLFLPALRKTKRIATSDKSGSFMGSDFTYSDLSTRDLEDYDLFLKKEIDVKGQKAWVIESIPRTKLVIKETGYTKSLVIIRQDNYVMIRAIHWVKKGGYLKFFDIKKLEKIDGIWTGTENHMTTKRGKKLVHKTIMKISNVKFNQSLDRDLFSIRALEKGI